MQKKISLLLIEDDQSFGSVLKSYLEINDFMVTWVDSGKYAVDHFRNSRFDLCILDVMLPHTDGFTIASQIRKINSEVPFIFLTAKTLREDILMGYNLGADDYVTKPFDTEVLILKIRAILKRTGAEQAPGNQRFEIGSIQFDFHLRQVTGSGEPRKLSPKEADLLKLLCEHKNSLLPREVALTRIWGDDGYFTTRSMDVFITRLRKYLADDPRIEIRNLHGSGFILSVPAD
jgi:two-component system, OmpR family, response regulator